MKNFLSKKISSLVAIAAFVVAIVAAGCVTCDVKTDRVASHSPVLTTEQMYKMAVADAAVADEYEIFPLVSLEKGAKYAVYNDEGKVLLFTHHRYPNSYPDGAHVTTSWGNVWTFTGGELADWFSDNSAGVTDWELRFKQLIGLNYKSNYTHFTAMWANSEDVFRPAYVTDTGDITMTNCFTESCEPSEEYKKWFDSTILSSYYNGASPWTRLGYTYDWADNGVEYGLSEFIIKSGSNVDVAYTVDTAAFVDMLKNGNWLPAADK